MKTEESNKLIAEFMGYKLARCNNGLAWDIGKSLPSHKHLFPIQGVLHTGNELNFHTSWDWLMPVIDKIESLGYCYDRVDADVFINKQSSLGGGNIIPNPMDHNTMTMLEKTYCVVIEFIKWYNQQKVLPDTI
jgi:hypothetical protein